MELRRSPKSSGGLLEPDTPPRLIDILAHHLQPAARAIRGDRLKLPHYKFAHSCQRPLAPCAARWTGSRKTRMPPRGGYRPDRPRAKSQPWREVLATPADPAPEDSAPDLLKMQTQVGRLLRGRSHGPRQLPAPRRRVPAPQLRASVVCGSPRHHAARAARSLDAENDSAHSLKTMKTMN